MKFFVMRHAQASFNASSDRNRPITDNGVEQTKRLLNDHAESLSQVNQLWSSDLLRARQTAEIVSDKTNLAVHEKHFLSPDGDVKAVLDELRSLPSEICLLIVSHQPLVGELVSFLLNGNVHQSHPYSTSEILELDLALYEPGMASLITQYLPS